MTVFLIGIVVVALAIEWLVREASGSPEFDGRRRVVAAVGVVVALSSRDLLWTYVGFEVCSLAVGTIRLRGAAASALALLGLIVASFGSGGTDLALMSPSPASTAALSLVFIGLSVKWLLGSHRPGIFATLGVVLAALFIRIVAWAPAAATALEPAVLVIGWVGMLVGGFVASRGRAAVGRGSVVFSVALVVVGSLAGPPAVPFLLLHLAASTVAVALLEAPSRLAVFVALGTLASVPPSPGFVSKFPLLSLLPSATLAIALASMVVLAVGCARAAESVLSPDAGERPRERVWVAAAIASLFGVGLGLWPEPMFELAALAAASWF